MDSGINNKRVLNAVAGSGKTSYIVDRLSTDIDSLIITYTTANQENLKEKVHIAINLIDDLCHEIVYHKHNSMDYDVMIDVVVECIKNLLV